MSPSLLLLLYLCIAAATEDKLYEVDVSPGLNATLPCVSVVQPGVQYHACRWYKEGVDPRLTGLVSRALPGGVLRWYVGADTRIWMEEDTLSLTLPTVNCSDAGVYLCYLAAPVGEQNREGRVQLTVTGCPTEEKVPEVPEIPVVYVVPAVPPNSPKLMVLVLVPVLVLVLALASFFLQRNQWYKPKKTPDRPLYPDLSAPLEKQTLTFSNFTLTPNSKICINV